MGLLLIWLITILLLGSTNAVVEPTIEPSSSMPIDGETFNLTCAHQQPSLQVPTWYRNDTELTELKGGEMVGSTIKFQKYQVLLHDGSYYCVMELDGGRVRSKSMYLMGGVQGLFFTSGPIVVSARIGQPLLINLPLYTARRHSVNWRFLQPNNARSPLDVGAVMYPNGSLFYPIFLEVDLPQKNNDLIVELVVGDDLTPTQKKVQFNMIPSQGEIKQYFTELQEFQWDLVTTVSVGTTRSFVCPFIAAPENPTYTWYFNDTRLTNRDPHLSVSKQVYHIRPSDAWPAGTLKCKATLFEEEKSAVIQIKVTTKPTWKTELPEKQTPDLSTNISLRCEAFSLPPSSYRWYKNGQLVAISGEVLPDFQERISFSSPMQMDLTNLVEEDSAIYQCEARNQYGSALTSSLIVGQPIPLEAIGEVSDVVFFRQVPAQLACIVRGAPAPVFEWSKDNSLTLPNEVEVRHNVLVFSSVTDKHAGQYKCSAVNKYSSKDITTQVHVLNKTELITRPQPVSVDAGSSLDLLCDAVADASQTSSFIVEWHRDGQPLSSTGGSVYPEYREADRLQRRLLFRNVTGQDAGLYTCMAKVVLQANLVTIENASATVSIHDAPPAPYNVRFNSSSCEPHLALHWDQTVGRDPIDHIVEYSSGQAWYTYLDRVVGTSTVVSPLPPQSVSFRVRSRNRMGVGPASTSTRSCAGKPTVPRINPRKVMATPQRAGEVLVEWEPLNEAEQVPNLSYRVRYSKQNQNVDDERAWFIPAAVNVSSMLLSSLDETSQYRISVVSIVSGLAVVPLPKDQVLLVFPGRQSPINAPESLSCEAQAAAVRCTWDPVAVADGYVLKLARGSNQEASSYFVDGRDTNTYTLQHLNSGTKVTIAAAAYSTGKNVGPYTVPVEVVPSIGVPQMSSLSLTTYGNALLASWSSSSPASSYFVRWVQTADFGGARSFLNTTVDTQNTFLTQLRPLSTYTICVIPANAAGEGAEMCRIGTTSYPDRSSTPEAPLVEVTRLGGFNVTFIIGPRGGMPEQFIIAYNMKGYEPITMSYEFPSTRRVEILVNHAGVYSVSTHAVYQNLKSSRSPEVLVTVDVDSSIPEAGKRADNSKKMVPLVVAIIATVIFLLVIVFIIMLYMKRRSVYYPVRKREEEGRGEGAPDLGFPDALSLDNLISPLDPDVQPRQSALSPPSGVVVTPSPQDDADSLDEYGHDFLPSNTALEKSKLGGSKESQSVAL